jgi:hypothetical protein
MKTMHICLLLAVFFCTMACSSRPKTEELSSGITGQVLLGPMTPVVRSDKIVPDRPFQAKIQILDEKREFITEFETDEEGKFKVPLPPGTYIISPVAPRPNMPPYPEEKTVTVEEGTFLETKVLFDTGIR